MIRLAIAALLVGCGHIEETETEDNRQWAWGEYVCSPGTSPGCIEQEWSTACSGVVVTVPYRWCATVTGTDGLYLMRYTAEPVSVEGCGDIEGRILDTWASLADGLESGGCDD